MRSFRFPRFAIILMVMTFLAILAAIGLATEMARTVQAGFGGPNLPDMWWSKLPLRFVLAFALFWAVGAVVYVVRFGLRRTGVHRFSNVETWTRSE